MNLSLTPISEITKLIGCTDVRSAEKWCVDMGIEIHMYNRRKYVVKEAVNLELELKHIDYLRLKYPKKYKDIYKANKEEDYLLIYELINSTKDTNEMQSHTEYKPKGSAADGFLKDIMS